MSKKLLTAAMAAAIAVPSLASAQTTVRVPIVSVSATVTGKWVLDPAACPDIREDFRDARVTTSRFDRREDRRDQRIVDCPASAYRFVPDVGQAPTKPIRLRRDGTATFIDGDAPYYGRGHRHHNSSSVVIEPRPVTVTPSYTPPVYTAPTYTAPTYTAPVYTAPTYGTYTAPRTTYSGSATYNSPSYSGTATYGGTTYTQPSYNPAPVYSAPSNNTGRYEYRNGQWIWVR